VLLSPCYIRPILEHILPVPFLAGVGVDVKQWCDFQ
jgi:hypothetical protein